MGRKIPFLLCFFSGNPTGVQNWFFGEGRARVKSGNNEHVAVDKSDLVERVWESACCSKKVLREYLGWNEQISRPKEHKGMNHQSVTLQNSFALNKVLKLYRSLYTYRAFWFFYVRRKKWRIFNLANYTTQKNHFGHTERDAAAATHCDQILLPRQTRHSHTYILHALDKREEKSFKSCCNPNIVVSHTGRVRSSLISFFFFLFSPPPRRRNAGGKGELGRKKGKKN